jgi:hypothetical protein
MRETNLLSPALSPAPSGREGEETRAAWPDRIVTNAASSPSPPFGMEERAGERRRVVARQHPK